MYHGHKIWGLAVFLVKVNRRIVAHLFNYRLHAIYQLEGTGTVLQSACSHFNMEMLTDVLCSRTVSMWRWILLRDLYIRKTIFIISGQAASVVLY